MLVSCMLFIVQATAVFKVLPIAPGKTLFDHQAIDVGAIKLEMRECAPVTIMATGLNIDLFAIHKR